MDQLADRPSRAHGGRNFGLDIARAVAITATVISHLLLELAAPYPILSTALVFLGQAGVELFFSLSGFLIGGLLIDLARQDLQPRTVLRFLFRRWMRTLPLYFATLAWATWSFDQGNWHAWFFLQNFFPREVNALPVAWSLVLEEYFYFFFPLSMLALSAVVGAGTRVVMATALALIVLCTACRFLNAYGSLGLGWDFVHINPFFRMDCAAYGVLASYLSRSRTATVAGFVARNAGAILFAALTVCAVFGGGVFVALLNLPPPILARTGVTLWLRPWFVFQDSMLDLAFAAVVLTLAFARPRPLRAGPVAWTVRQASLLSYSIYLVHLPVMGKVEIYLLNRPGLLKIFIQLAASVLVALCTYTAVERPALMLRDWVSRGDRARRPRVRLG